MTISHYHIKIDHYDPLLKVNQTDYEFDYSTDIEVINKFLIPYLSNENLVFAGKRIINDNIRSIKVYGSEYDIKTCVKIGDELLGQNSWMVYTDESILERDDTVPEITKQLFERAKADLDAKKETSRTDSSLHTKLGVIRNPSKRVFIVHGHDNQTRTEVELLIKELDYEPVVLFKEADRGLTIIEKLERETENIDFAIVIYSHCDDGKAKEDTDFKPRARQNVVFEHGMLYAKIGRKNVLALLEEGVEAPGDLSGVIYKVKDNSGKWKFDIAKEMRAAGLNVDFNKIRD